MKTTRGSTMGLMAVYVVLLLVIYVGLALVAEYWTGIRLPMPWEWLP